MDYNEGKSEIINDIEFKITCLRNNCFGSVEFNNPSDGENIVYGTCNKCNQDYIQEPFKWIINTYIKNNIE